MAKKITKKGKFHAVGNNKETKSTKKSVSKKRNASKTLKKKLPYASAFAVVFIVLIVASLAFLYIKSSPAKDTTIENGDIVMQGGEWLVKVNDGLISVEEFNDASKLLPQQLTGSIPPEQLRNIVVDQLINYNLLLQDAQSKGITATTAEADKVIQDTLTEAGSNLETLLQNLAIRGINYSTLQESFRKQLIVDRLLKEKFDFNLSEKDLKDYYDNNKDTLVQYKASHILICFNGTQFCNENRTEQEALDLANEILDKAKSGQNFEDLATEFSNDPGSAAKGGDLGWFSTGFMVPEFENAVKSMKKNQLSTEPVKSIFGYHIIYLNDVKESFDDLKDDIKAKLENEEKNNKINDYLTELRSKAVLEYNPQFFPNETDTGIQQVDQPLDNVTQ